MNDLAEKPDKRKKFALITMMIIAGGAASVLRLKPITDFQDTSRISRTSDDMPKGEVNTYHEKLAPKHELTDRGAQLKQLNKFSLKLQKIREIPDKKQEFLAHKDPPTRQLITSQTGAELIEIVYADGSKTYEPNFPKYDVTNGKFISKEF